MTVNLFIGFDEREQLAYDVCAYSIKRRCENAKIHPVKHRELRSQGLFDRPWRIDERGQYWDDRDGKPFSTQFSHTRFLVPEMAKAMGIKGWAIFCDCDFMWLVNPAGMMQHCDQSKAVMVCQHEHKPSNTAKMDGMQQTLYPRKNWSSMILWNLDHPSNAKCDRVLVNEADGGRLHNFSWLHESEIGSLPLGWNFLLGHTSVEHDWKAIHYTDGGPWIDGWTFDPILADGYELWIEERNCMQAQPGVRLATPKQKAAQ